MRLESDGNLIIKPKEIRKLLKHEEKDKKKKKKKKKMKRQSRNFDIGFCSYVDFGSLRSKGNECIDGSRLQISTNFT